ncbi:unnamed protein product, partial [Urochloa humidicola]
MYQLAVWFLPQGKFMFRIMRLGRDGTWAISVPGSCARVAELQRRTVAEEDALSREMAQVQEGHNVVEVELDVSGLVCRVTEVLDRAHALRLRTMKRAVEILQPAQAAELLVAAADMEIGFREFGASGPVTRYISFPSLLDAGGDAAPAGRLLPVGASSPVPLRGRPPWAHARRPFSERADHSSARRLVG